MSAEKRPFDPTHGTLFKCKESMWRAAKTPILIIIFTLTPILFICIGVMLPTFIRGYSHVWTIPLTLACTAFVILLIWIQCARNIARTWMVLTEHGLMFHLAISKYYGDFYVRFSDIPTFARARGNPQTLLIRYLVDYQDVRPASTHNQNPENVFLVGNGCLFREDPPPGLPLMGAGKPQWLEGQLLPLNIFEKNWQEGEIGRSLRKNRPDLAIPNERTPLPRAYNPNPDYGG